MNEKKMASSNRWSQKKKLTRAAKRGPAEFTKLLEFRSAVGKHCTVSPSGAKRFSWPVVFSLD